MAEREGFEPPCRLPGKTLSRRPRYDHFGTSPFITSLDGAPLDSPSRCALAVAFGDSPPALACGGTSLGGASYILHLAARSRSPSATPLRRLNCGGTSLGGASLHSPPRCALAVAFGNSPPAPASG